MTVKTNPAEGLFAGTHAKAGAFRTAFLSQVANLDAVTLTGIKMGIDDEFNEWDSISGPDAPRPLNPFEIEVKYTAFADSTIRDKIATKLSTLGDSPADDILNRATTQTCGGCSSGVERPGFGRRPDVAELAGVRPHQRAREPLARADWHLPSAAQGGSPEVHQHALHRDGLARRGGHDRGRLR